MVSAQGFDNLPDPIEDVNKVVDNTPDSIAKALMSRPAPGSTRKGQQPVMFLVGNSTMRNGTLGNGNNGQWGWGYFFPKYFDAQKIAVENRYVHSHVLHRPMASHPHGSETRRLGGGVDRS